MTSDRPRDRAPSAELEPAVRRRRRPLGASLTLGLTVVGLLVAAALLGRLWTPYDPNAMNFAAQLAGPSLAHPMGTDNFGRDTLSRVLVGAFNTVLVGLISVGIGSALGLLLGAVAGYLGGLVDDLVMRLLDALLAFPTVLLALLLAAIMGAGLVPAMLAVGLASVPAFARLTRAGVLSVKALDYVEGARALGAAESRVLFRHVIPNILSPLVVQASFAFGIAVLAEAALSYLGLGSQPPTASWGRMLRDAQTFIDRSPWATLFPGLVIAVAVLGWNLLGDGLRDQLDPRGR